MSSLKDTMFGQSFYSWAHVLSVFKDLGFVKNLESDQLEKNASFTWGIWNTLVDCTYEIHLRREQDNLSIFVIIVSK